MPSPTATTAPGSPTNTPAPILTTTATSTAIPTATPEHGTGERYAAPLPEDETGSYDVDPVTGEKIYLMFNTYSICMDFLNNDELCSGYERCYHK